MGHVPYYVVYIREKDRDNLPTDELGQHIEGFVLTRGGHDNGPTIKLYYNKAGLAIIQCPYAISHNCDLTFQTNIEAQSHGRIHEDFDTPMENTDTYVCITCNQSFTSEELLSLHRNTEHRKYTCTICSQDLDSEGTLRDHERTSHAHVNCNECDRFFNSEGELREHQRTVHQHSICSACGREFASREELEQHQQSDHAPQGAQSFQQQLDALRQATEAADRATAKANEAALAADSARERLLQDEAAVMTAHEERLQQYQDRLEASLLAERGVLEQRSRAIDDTLTSLRQ